MLIHIVHQNSDPMEGRGHWIPKAAVLDKPQDTFGIKTHTFPLCGTVEQYVQYAREEEARREIANLPYEHKAALGVTAEKLGELKIKNGTVLPLDKAFARASAGDTIWLAMGVSSAYGQGHQVVRGVFLTEQEAEKATSQYAAPVQMMLARDLDHHEELKKEALRQQVTEKLSPAAKKLLGLNQE